MKMKYFPFFIIGIIAIMVMGTNYCTYHPSHAPTADQQIRVKINDKQIVTDMSNNSTTHEYVVFTDKGAYLINEYFNMKLYSQLIKDSTYNITVGPSFSFQYEGYIITANLTH